MSTVLSEDFKYIYEKDIDWNQLKEKNVWVTGATGYIGSLIIRFLLYLNHEQGFNVHIMALVRDVKKAKNMFHDSCINYYVSDLSETIQTEIPVDYIFHCACVTKSKQMVEFPVEVAKGIVDGTEYILKLAAEKQCKSMVYLSSMEVYGQMEEDHEYADEGNLGKIDITKPRSCYPMGKRMAETYCYHYASEYNVPVKVARLAQTFGAGVPKEENRVFAQFAKSIISDEDIVLYTDGSSYGNYCYSADVLWALYMILFSGSNGEAYNIANEDSHVTIRQMAEIVSKELSKGKVAVRVEIPKNTDMGYAAKSNLYLNSEKLRRLGWKPGFKLTDMYQRMIKYWEQID